MSSNTKDDRLQEITLHDEHTPHPNVPLIVSSLSTMSQRLIAYFREWLTLTQDYYTHKKLT